MTSAVLVWGTEDGQRGAAFHNAGEAARASHRPVLTAQKICSRIREDVMPVFISHRTADDEKARSMAGYLQQRHNIKCYLDDFDPQAASTKHITDVIVRAVNTCTHLMALITNATAGSWWVPFEIGVARQGERRITSYDNSTVTLPEYLTEWPVLRSQGDLDTFAEAYHLDKQARPIIEKYGEWRRDIRTAEDFHSRLKASLRGYAIR
ncbi:MAG: toll/interleukin-1 receptor domain-containing protein [Phycisphaerales bacterium]|nr:toll/interleukin-1 receptor domain-containing protein [Phycisphaerales bacterium]